MRTSELGVADLYAPRRAVEMGDGFLGAGSISTATFADEVAPRL